MKLILKEYLSSLKERGDLDKSVLPNLLSELGLRVLNTPMIGTRQNGVDIAAVGKVKGEDQRRYLYLFCIKAGNVSRREWDGSAQDVRAELNEIRDVYLRSNVAQENADLPVKICLCCGGELEETVLTNWAGYTVENTTDKISYEEWNGDRLADLMMRCLLARELLDDESRRYFQKAVAMVNEPKACYDYTQALLESLLSIEKTTPKVQLLRLRQSYICLHAIVSWATDEGNLESTYKPSELGMLFCWNIVRMIKPKKRPTIHDKALFSLFDQFLKLYLSISELFFKKTVYAHRDTLHALSVAVRSSESVDVNLAMYELLGRLATRGIWSDHLSKKLRNQEPDLSTLLEEEAENTVKSLVSVINSNPTLCSPIKDEHMIEISLVMYLALSTRQQHLFFPWLIAIAGRTTFSLLRNTQYPTSLRDYDALLSHPVSNEQSYRDEACAGSVLYPFLFMWLQHVADDTMITAFVERLEKTIPNCTHQAWLPDEKTDDLIWTGGTHHGVGITGLRPKNGHKELAELLSAACENCSDIGEMSAIKAGLIPLLLIACRHYRLPVPPNFWFIGP